MDKDYYKILGVDKNSSEDDIKMAYKKLAMKYHPDRNPNNPDCEEKFKEIKNAYESLINKNNQNLNNSFNNFNFDNMNFSDFVDTESGLDDIFKIIFSKEFEKDINDKIISTINIDLEQAIYGSILNIKFFFQNDCTNCIGKGFNLGNNVKVCNKCSGSGLYVITQGVFAFKQKCFKCEGRGYISVDICSFCKGVGKVDKDLLCQIDVNPFSDNDSLAPVKYIGKDSDVKLDNYFVLVKIKSHPLFSRKEENSNDIYCKFIIDFIKAILGGYVKIYTIFGYIKHKIRKGSQSGEIYKIKEFGANFNKNKDIGDLYLEIFIEIPLNINYYQNFLIKKIKLSILSNELNYPLIINLQNLIDNFYYNILKK